MFFGFSYGEIFLTLGAAAALIGPKDLPVIARTAGRIAGRAIGYVQLARGHFDTVMQQSQARQVHKELKDTMAQLDAIRHEIRSVSFLNPGPLTRRMLDNLSNTNASNANETVAGNANAESTPMPPADSVSTEQTKGKSDVAATTSKMSSSQVSDSCNIHSQATSYARLAEFSVLQSGSLQSGTDTGELIGDVDLLNVLPISAESAGLLPKRPGDIKGSDIVLEATVEAEVAHNAQKFFVLPENQIKYESKNG